LEEYRSQTKGIMNNAPEVIKHLKAAKNVLLGGHPSMDGDALGSVLTAYHTLTAAGKTCTMVTQDVGAGKYDFLAAADKLVHLRDLPEDMSQFDTAMIFDCGAVSRANRTLSKLDASTVVLNIDHHIDNNHFGDAAIVEPHASSTGEVLYRLLVEAGFKLNKDAAEALFVAIVTDTGRFSFNNSTVHSYRIVADLVEQFALDVNVLTGKIYRSKTIGRIRLEGLVGQGLEQRLDGRLSVARVTKEMLDATGCDDAAASEMVVIAKSVGGAEACILFRELGPEDMRVSLRSEGSIKVNEIAAKFGGGGHLRAAGLHVKRPIEAAKVEIIAAVEEALLSAIG
ncbi:DHH family phosphoesterase, partial [Planctomycetota bacterium]|nr:DHH family phosphoesterase [Planctomycetota bacterium]